MKYSHEVWDFSFYQKALKEVNKKINFCRTEAMLLALVWERSGGGGLLMCISTHQYVCAHWLCVCDARLSVSTCETCPLKNSAAKAFYRHVSISILVLKAHIFKCWSCQLIDLFHYYLPNTKECRTQNSVCGEVLCLYASCMWFCWSWCDAVKLIHTGGNKSDLLDSVSVLDLDIFFLTPALL